MSERGFLQTSIYLTADDQRMLKELQQQTGLNRSELLRRSVQLMFSGDGNQPERRRRLIEIAEEIKRLA